MTLRYGLSWSLVFLSVISARSQTAAAPAAQSAAAPAAQSATAPAAQPATAPDAQPATINGYAMDTDAAAVPGATVTISGPTFIDHRAVKADAGGFFELRGLRPTVPYHVTVHADGFRDYNSPELVLLPGQVLFLDGVKIAAAEVETITVVPMEELAVEQVQAEEKQRVLGVIPNFYVVYGGANVAPMSAKLKYKLAYKASTDVVNFAAAAFIAGIDQAADTPHYVQGAKGFGQRMGASYANGTSDILIGGAILPSMFHQDPRYFYQGTGTNKSRALHAIASPFLCKSDSGQRQFNISSIGGDLASGALANIYYPPSDRGPGLVFDQALVTTGGRMVNALLQEFLFSKMTSKASRPK